MTNWSHHVISNTEVNEVVWWTEKGLGWKYRIMRKPAFEEREKDEKQHETWREPCQRSRIITLKDSDVEAEEVGVTGEKVVCHVKCRKKYALKYNGISRNVIAVYVEISERWGYRKGRINYVSMAGWHHGLDGHESEWTPGDGDGQGGLACCNSWHRKESDMTERLNWTDEAVKLKTDSPSILSVFNFSQGVNLFITVINSHIFQIFNMWPNLLCYHLIQGL